MYDVKHKKVIRRLDLFASQFAAKPNIRNWMEKINLKGPVSLESDT